MWYNFDIRKFGWQMLPPILRGKFLFAIIRVLLAPLVYIYDHFRDVKKMSDKTLEITGQVVSIEKALNDKYLFENRDIYISDVPEQLVLLYKRIERKKTAVFRKRSEVEKTENVFMRGEGRLFDFIVNIPSDMRTYEADIRRIIDFYKPAGRSYTINYYDNE